VYIHGQGWCSLKKKTYVFDSRTLEVLKLLCEELGKKETQIIREALKLYFDHHRSRKELISSVESLVERIERITNQVAELSYKLGRCEERNRNLEEEIRRLKGA